MKVKDVSQEWSERERLSVITEIAESARNRMALGRFSATATYAALESITFLSAMPAAFLEANRQMLTKCMEDLKTIPA